jgi:hypothetical protein
MLVLLAQGFEWRGFEEAFWQGLWGGIFQLLTLGLVAVIANLVYRRYRQRADARQELIDAIDQFTIRLYQPRKIYQLLTTPGHPLLSRVADPQHLEAWRARKIERTLEQLVAAIGRFRALQVKLVPLFGYHAELFAYYLAIWRYLKEVRERMERLESLYFHHEKPESMDAFYRLIDSFRYRLLTERTVWRPPGLVRPPQDLLLQMRQQADSIYAEYFKLPAP